MSMTRTSVAIVGAGPAGLMVSHLLAREGVDSVVVDSRSRETIATTHRAGILEAGSVRLLVDDGVSDRVLTEGREHEGIELRFDGHGHRVDFQDLVGRSVWLYPQTSVFADLAARREADGGDVRWSVTDTAVSDVTGRPTLSFTDADGVAQEVSARYLVGADGSHSVCRRAVPEAKRQTFYREYPFAWFGVLVEAPPSAPELVYASSPRGFALVSQRTDTVQRMYFQCDLDEDPVAWSDDRIWDELQTRVAGDGLTLNEGPVVERTVLPFRSFVHEPMRHGNLLLAGDAAHTVPPTGAKGLNLALHDARLLAERLTDAVRHDRPEVLDGYTEAALDRVWRAQHFSSWLTTLLHTAPGETEFDERRRRAELTSIVTSRHGSAYLAEAYTGWSLPARPRAL
ncbi:MAG: 4-hydroxybenzoate 3-monooxygenase [Lapillicoccus sp.]